MFPWILFPALFMAQEVRFPPLKANNLSGQSVAMPSGFEGEVNLLLIAFQREQQSDVDTWLMRLPSLVQQYPQMRYYELPTIDKSNPIFRFVLRIGMRAGIPDKQQRARTITLHLDKSSFKKSLGIETESSIYALLVDQSGRVLWREEGLYTDAKAQSLIAALAK